jgi:hypothetical protein
MKCSSIELPPFERLVLSFVVWAMLFCPAASPQDAPNRNESGGPQKVARRREVESDKFRKAGWEFVPPPWPPIDVDAAEIAVNSQTPCPLPAVLQGASQHATEFSENLERFTATEIIQSVDAQKYGPWDHLRTNTFDYMALVTHSRTGAVYVDESRMAKGRSEAPSIRTTGLAVTAMIFHPQNINSFEFICEGTGEWRGKPSWMVHFAEKAGNPADFQVIHVAGRRFGVRLKGRAWIAGDNNEIEHMDVDLLEPIPKIQLLTEHLSIDYGSVRFTNGTSRLWLPLQADFYMDLGGHHFFNHHELRNFLLFSVGVQQEVQQPKSPK